MKIQLIKKINKNATGSKIRSLREKAGISRDGLASMLCCNKEAIGMWETGQSLPDPRKIENIGLILDCTSDMIIVPEEYYEVDLLPKANLNV